MAEELAGCTVLMVAHRGAALADWNLRVDMAWGRIRAVTKDRKQDDDEDDVAEGVGCGRWPGERDGGAREAGQGVKR
ncbi:hypothetical protein BBO_00108 [Beauveria brongniartii RCEF 3172]|uniref:Uncharacterized protein n=1 Tax=Beauveria brongniartii RCEF 3172 TaxID=1081107 RepID=A0A167KVW6_9HYPO|nr:hypothetical protein BBO_00108 [Beauveria brongniartii RCEF 3172]